MIHVTSLRVRRAPPIVEVGVHRKPEFKGHASYYINVQSESRRGPFWARFLSAIAFCDTRMKVK